MLLDETAKPSRWRVFWPEIDDLVGAREAMDVCWWLTLVVVGLQRRVALAFGRSVPSPFSLEEGGQGFSIS